MELKDTLVELNEAMCKAQEQGDDAAFQEAGNKANELLLGTLAELGYKRNKVAKAIISSEILREKESKLYAIFMGKYAGVHCQWPLLIECSDKLYKHVREGFELSLEMNDKLGFKFFAEAKDRGDWRESLDSAYADIQAVIEKAKVKADEDLHGPQARDLDETAARDGYDGLAPSVLAYSMIQHKEVEQFIKIMHRVALAEANRGMARDAIELIQQWMLRERDAGKLALVAKDRGIRLVNPMQAIGFGLMVATLRNVADGKAEG